MRTQIQNSAYSDNNWKSAHYYSSSLRLLESLGNARRIWDPLRHTLLFLFQHQPQIQILEGKPCHPFRQVVAEEAGRGLPHEMP